VSGHEVLEHRLAAAAGTADRLVTRDKPTWQTGNGHIEITDKRWRASGLAAVRDSHSPATVANTVLYVHL